MNVVGHEESETRIPSRTSSALVESDFEDSFLKEILREPSLVPLPVAGERLGGLGGSRYEILELVGSGGMGRVFRALDHELQRTVALKFLLSCMELSEPQLTALIREEAQATARLNHDNIVDIHDVSLWHSGFRQRHTTVPLRIPFLVMEYLEGEPLVAALRREKLGLRRALEIMIDVAAGLAHAHERNIVHLDLKPGNIFILPNGRAKLLDFGLSRLLLGTSSELKSSGSGTPPYMSPQQWRREPPSPRDDTWACGVLLFEMLTGELPFSGANLAALRAHTLSPEPMPRLRHRHPELPVDVDRFVASSLEKEPAKRPAHGAELLKNLCELQERLALRPPRSKTAAERRQVTVVACRLSLTPGMDTPDPEDVSELEAAFHRACARIFQEAGGSIITSMGAEVLASFGSPQLHEEDSELAVRAALRQTRELPRELLCLWRHGLSVRVGGHTDLVALADFMPELHGTTPALQGEAPRIASWLATQAEPDTVLLSHQTHALVRGCFQTRFLGQRTFEGISGAQIIGLHQVLHERRNATRFDRSLVMGPLTPLTGRDGELQRVTWLREEARQHGGFILLRGEAGIGKSRLVQELHDREAPGTSTWFRSQCWQQFHDSAFHPLIDWLQRFLEFSPQDSAREKVRKLEDQLAASGLSPEQVPPLAALLSLPLPEGSPFVQMSPERQRERGVQALSALLQRLGEKRPLVFLVEDVHWADPSTLQFLGFLLENIERLQVCVLLTSRPEFPHAWAGHSSFRELRLAPLSPEATAALVQVTAQGRALPAETLQQLVARTDGIPLFVEELTRMVLERSGTSGAPSEGTIPTTLNELLQSRLDQLSPRARALAQFAALLGREFSHEVLRAVSFLQEEELRRDIERLERAGLLFQQGWPPQLTYAFKHSLVQDAAYQSLPRSTRKHYHTRVVHVLSERFPLMVEEQPELLAYHATRAGLAEQAVGLWQRAGQRAAAKSALSEAISHLTRALEQLSLLPASRERDEREVVLRVALGEALVATKGYAAPAVEEVYTRARELSQRYGDTPFSVLWGLWVVALVRGNRADIGPMAERFSRLVETRADPTTQVVLHAALGTWNFWRGAYTEALRHFTRAKEVLHEEQSLGTLARIRGGGSESYFSEQVLLAYLYTAFGESMVGHIGRAREAYRQALSLAEQMMQHPYAVALTLSFCVSIEYELGEPEVARDLANRLIAVSAGNGFLFPLAIGYCVQGWATAQLGDAPSGIATIQQGLALIRAMGALLIYPTCLVCLLKAYLRAGQYTEGLAATREGLEMLPTLLAHRARPDLLRLQGEFLLAQGETEAARTSLEQALEEARSCGGTLHELRVALSLSRLLRQSGGMREAHLLLAQVSGKFPADTDLRDYEAARQLLAEPSSPEPPLGTTSH